MLLWLRLVMLLWELRKLGIPVQLLLMVVGMLVVLMLEMLFLGMLWNQHHYYSSHLNPLN